jgi:hypothetical protein
MQAGRIVGTNFVLVASSLCLVLDSAPNRDVLAQAVDGEAATPLENEAWTPVDIPLSNMTLFVLKLASTSLTNSSAALSSSDM